MPTVSASSVVEATIEDVFDFIDDYRNIPRIQPHFTSVRLAGEKERGLGAEIALEGRFHGLPMRVRNRIIGYSYPTRLVSVSEGAVLSRSTWQLEPLAIDPAATHVSLTLDYKVQRTLGGLFVGMGSSLLPLFHHELQSMTDESLRRLRAIFAARRAGAE